MVTAVVIGGVAFYGGMKYAGAKSGNIQANTADTFGQGRGNQGLGGVNGRFTAGQIIAKDTQSITIKMRDGSTKIVLFGGSTEISKFAAGTSNDLSVGQNVSIQGSANQDGSVTASTIQVRPAIPTPSPAK